MNGKAASAMIIVRPLRSVSEFQEAEEVQVSAWGFEGRRGVTPKDIMIAINDNGGLALGAFDGTTMAGFALLLPGYNGKKVYMYSHQTGVVQKYQSSGVGYLLKLEQRKISLKRGCDVIAWTFDPLIARNAHFNFRKLGTIARNYLVDYYGQMSSPLNQGWPTDRFLCEWLIRPAAARRVRAFYRLDVVDAHVAIEGMGREPYPVCKDWSVDLGARRVLVDIPSDALRLKAQHPADEGRWREASREVFQRYFAAGFSAVALLSHGGGLAYLLTKARLPKTELAKHARS